MNPPIILPQCMEVPRLFADTMDELLSERQKAMSLRTHAQHSAQMTSRAYGAQCDAIWRLNVRIARRASA